MTGRIPSEIGLLTELTSLILKENRLTGSIPTQIGLAIALEILDLGESFLARLLSSIAACFE